VLTQIAAVQFNRVLNRHQAYQHSSQSAIIQQSNISSLLTRGQQQYIISVW